MKQKNRKQKISHKKQSTGTGLRRLSTEGVLRLLIGIYFVSLPFVCSISGYEKFRVPKDVWSAFFVLLIAAVFLITRRFEIRFRPRTWEFGLGAALVYVAVHSLLSKRPEVGLFGFSQIAYFVALLLILIQIAGEQFQKRLWIWIAVTGAINAVLTILQYFGMFPIMTKPGGEVLAGRLNAAGFIGEVNTGGFVFGLNCLILLYGVLAEKRKLIRLLAALLFFINLAGLGFTRTLTAIVAFVLCLLVWALFHHWWLFRWGERLVLRLVLFWTVAVAGLAGTAGVMVTSGAYERVQLVWNQVREGNWTEVTAGRQPVYVITWQMIKDRPWLGHGLNTFGLDFFFYRSGTAIGQSVNWLNQAGTFREAHNEYLQVWEELGFWGLLFFVGLLLWPVVKAFRVLAQTQDAQTFYWVGVLCLGILYTAVNGLAFFPFHVSLGGAYIALLLGGLRYFETSEESRFRIGREARLLKVFVFSGLALWPAYPQFQKWRANSEMGIGADLLERSVSRDVPREQRSVLLQAAEQRLDRAERFYPHLYEIHNLKGGAAIVRGRPEEALRHFQKAAGYLPSPEVFTNMAGAYLVQKKYDHARPLLEAALRYNQGYLQAQRALRLLEENSH